MPKTTSYFPGIGVIPYLGPDASNPLAFRYYNPKEMIDGRPLKDHLRFSVAYWHSFRGSGSDPFGVGTIRRGWERGSDPVAVSKHGQVIGFYIPLERNEDEVQRAVVKLGEAVEQVLQETGMNEEALSRLFDLRRPLPE